jgi:GH15 family glucan-1,4-alpha-glucosidase
MTKQRELLAVRTSVGGLARYPIDYYHAAVTPSTDVPGNPWIITTLWDAQWHIAMAKTPKDLEEAKKTLEWAQKLASPAGLLPEQMHPLTGAPLSVAPLTWSHATYVETVLKYLEKEKTILIIWFLVMTCLNQPFDTKCTKTIKEHELKLTRLWWSS